MEFGVVLQPNPPASGLIAMMKRAEAGGFGYGWTFDSHVLWQETFVLYPRILESTSTMIVGPMVTNPGTRDWSVIASMFATLNDSFGNRTICGIGRGDSAVRVINGKPVTLATLREAIGVIRLLANGQPVNYKGTEVRLPWGEQSRLPIWVAAYGPKALALAGQVGDGFILQLADPDITAWSVAAVRAAAEAAGRDPDSVSVCVAAPAYVTDGSDAGLEYGRSQCRWFGGMVGNHVADIVRRYGADGTAVPGALSEYIAGRSGYDYNEHGRAGNTHAAFVPDEVIDRFCLIGPASVQVERLRQLQQLGVSQFAIYLQHDAKDATLAAYGDTIIPEINARRPATSR